MGIGSAYNSILEMTCFYCKKTINPSTISMSIRVNNSWLACINMCTQCFETNAPDEVIDELMSLMDKETEERNKQLQGVSFTGTHVIPSPLISTLSQQFFSASYTFTVPSTPQQLQPATTIKDDAYYKKLFDQLTKHLIKKDVK